MKKKFFQLILFALVLVMASTVCAAKASPEQQRADRLAAHLRPGRCGIVVRIEPRHRRPISKHGAPGRQHRKQIPHCAFPLMVDFFLTAGTSQRTEETNAPAVLT